MGVAFQASKVTDVALESDEELVSFLDEQEVAAETGPTRSRAEMVLEMAGDLSMLDVFVTGMFVANAVLASLGDVLLTELDQGFWVLIPAVVLGWIHSVLCKTIAYDGVLRSAKNRAILNARSAKEEQTKKQTAEERKQGSFFACWS